MELFEVIKKRRSVRRFEKGKEVGRDLVEKLLAAGVEAPTAGNLQVWRFFVVLNPELKKALARAAYYQEFVADAPVAIVVAADLNQASKGYGERGKNVYALQDTAAAIENILLAAYDLGLGSCWVGAFDEISVSEVLGLPSHIRPLAILPIGFPAGEGRKPPRKLLSEVVSWLT